MDTVGKTQDGRRPGGQAGNPARGQSGEGSRSVMEQLIQQEKKRDAQLPKRDALLPREGSGPAETASAP
jgi:hypothetical protein